MDNLARNLDGQAVVQEVGVVRRAAEGQLLVTTGAGELRAERAVSCLVEPSPGDRVLAATLTDGRCWVLAVLERDAARPTELRVDGDLQVNLPAGRFSVATQEGIDLVSAAEVSVVAPKFRLNALDGSVAFQRLCYLGRYLQSEVARIKSVASSFDAVLDRFSQKVKRSYRTVEDDQLRAERIDYKAKRTLGLHSENALVTAEKLVKLDGEQIHVG